MQLKLRLLIITIASLQLSLCAVIRDSHATTNRTDRFRNFLLSIPNVEAEKVDKFIDLVKNIVTPNGRQYESLLELLFYGTNISKDEQTEMIARDISMTDEDLVKIERNLNNKLTSNETQRIIKILRKLGRDRNSEERMNAVSEVMVHAIPTALNIPDNCISMQTLTDFQRRRIDLLQEEQKNVCSLQ